MKRDGLEVRLRPTTEQNAFFTEYYRANGAACCFDNGPHTFINAEPYQHFEVCVGLEESFTPYSAEALAIEIETTSILCLDQTEVDTQTWLVPLDRKSTSPKYNHYFDAACVKEYRFGSYTFWTRNESAAKYTSVVLPFLLPEVGGRITVRISRNKRFEIEPRLPMRKYDTIPPRAPNNMSIGGPTIIDQRWYKTIGGKNGRPIDFVFEVCDDQCESRLLVSTMAKFGSQSRLQGCSPPQFATAVEGDDSDDKEHYPSIKVEDALLTTEALLIDQVDEDLFGKAPYVVTPKSAESHEVKDGNDREGDLFAEAMSSKAAESRALKRTRPLSNSLYNTSYHPVDDFLDSGPENATSRNHARTPPSAAKTGYIQFSKLDDDGNRIKTKGRPVGWRKAVHSRAANGVEPYSTTSAIKRDAPDQHTQPAKKRGRPRKVPQDEVDEGQAVVTKHKSLEHDPGSTLPATDSESVMADRPLQGPPSHTADSSAVIKKAMLKLKLEEIKAKQEELRVRRELLSLGEAV